MIWHKIKNFIVRYSHWFILPAVLIAFLAFIFSHFDSARVYVFGPAEKVTVKVK